MKNTEIQPKKGRQMHTAIKMAVVVSAVILSGITAVAGVTPWHQEIYEPSDDPTYGGSNGNQLHDCGTSTHVQWARYGGQGYRHSSGQSTMGPGGAGGIWYGGGSQHTINADEAKTHTGQQRITMDLRVSAISDNVNIYPGEMKANPEGRTQDLDTYVWTSVQADGAGLFKIATSGGDIGGLDLWRHANDDEAWYQVVWDFDTVADACTVSVVDDVLGKLGSVSAPVVNQNTPTFEAVNGLNVLSFANSGFLFDNVTFVKTPEPGTLVLLALAGCGLLRRRR